MSKSLLEKLALFASGLVFVAAAWFWTAQIGDVLETLRLAYG